MKLIFSIEMLAAGIAMFYYAYAGGNLAYEIVFAALFIIAAIGAMATKIVDEIRDSQ